MCLAYLGLTNELPVTVEAKSENQLWQVLPIGLRDLFSLLLLCFFVMIGMTYISSSVAETMFNMVNFGSDETYIALMALMAAMIASILWGVLC